MPNDAALAAVGPSPVVEITAYAAPYEATIGATGPVPVVELEGSAASPSASIAATGPRPRVGILGAASDESPSSWQVRAVDDRGKLLNLIGGVSISNHHDGINGDEYVDCSIPTLHPDSDLFDLFDHEIQFWLDGEFRAWGIPARLNAGKADLSIRVNGLFDYMHDNYVGGVRPNHIVSPHEDPNDIGSPPAFWTAASGVDEYALVDNNFEYHQAKKAVQINDADTEDENSYIRQRETVDADLHRIPFAASAWMHIADSELPVAPPYGGSSFENRGVVIVRYASDGTTQIGDPVIAQITEDTPRNISFFLETPELTPDAGDILEVRLYCPDAWVSYKVVRLDDGRGIYLDRVDKAVAFRSLVEHAQDVNLGKQNHRIIPAVSGIGEVVSETWRWCDRHNVGQELERLADSFEFRMENTATTRTLRAKRRVGIVRSDVITKDNAAGVTEWALAVDRLNTYSRIFHQGEGSGITRDEWVAEASGSTLNGNKREGLMHAPVGVRPGPLRDEAEELLARTRSAVWLPSVTVSGELAKTIRAGDTVTLNINHGRAQFHGQARALAVDFDGRARTAALSLEPVT